MLIHLAYGKHGLDVELADATVIRPRYVPGLADEREAIRQAIREPIGAPPLRELVEKGQRVVIVHSDITRATPNDRILRDAGRRALPAPRLPQPQLDPGERRGRRDTPDDGIQHQPRKLGRAARQGS